jgi:hypothetical protein
MTPDQMPPDAGMMPPEAPEQESTVTCPNCGAPLKLEMPEAPEQPAQAPGGPAPSLRDTLTQAMGGGQ